MKKATPVFSMSRVNTLNFHILAGEEQKLLVLVNALHLWNFSQT